MNLAFYYHIPICKKSDRIFVPSYLGVFLQSLAEQVNQLHLVMHQATGNQIEECDFELSQANVTWHNLGPKTPAWHRAIFYRKILKEKLQEIKLVETFLVRSPTPLSPYFHRFFPRNKICFMIVGDYSEGVKNNTNTNLRGRLINIYLRFNNWLFNQQIRKTKVLVNSNALFQKYEKIAPNINEIKTTTLSEKDFFKRRDTCQNSTINLLFTGRIDFQKGLKELVEATAILIEKGLKIKCNIVGWEENNKQKVENELIQLAKKLGIENMLIFHGRKKIGEELNTMYRMADIYVLPSYHEGFPRTIWEALANSLPVVTTTVGSIPHYLKDKENAILIEPKNSEVLFRAILELSTNHRMRKGIISKGRELASEMTLEIQTRILIEQLEKKIHLNKKRKQ
jgi:glycosyltransferase involved in cell wall biosynthesis